MLIILVLFASNSFGQKSGTVNTGLDGPVTYNAKDSIIASIETQIVRLYGEASVEYDGISLKAENIMIDIQNNEVIATYGLDSLGKPFGKPLFKGEGEESTSEYIKYNFETKQGYVKEVRAQQQDGYLHMEEAKIHPNEQIHLNNGKFTTCDAEVPHYHFKMTKAIIVPDKRIVTGPIMLKIFKIPTPLAAPFAYLPNNQAKKHGFIIPFPTLPTAIAGFGLSNFGYYFPINERVETTFLGSVFTTGMFQVQNQTDYSKRYKYSGSTTLKFDNTRGRFYDTTQYTKWTVNWKHRQDSKAHPTLSFNTDVNFISDNNPKVSLDPINTQFFNNQFNSAINGGKVWKAGNFSGNMTLRSSLQQNAAEKKYTIELPTYNLTINRFTLGDFQRNKIGSKWYDDITINYRLDATNQIEAGDSLFSEDLFGTLNEYSKNGIKHNIIVQSNLRLFGGRVLFNPRVAYNEIWNFQYEERIYNSPEEKLDTNFINNYKAGRNLEFSGGVTQNYFGYYRFKGAKKTRFRHAMVAGTRATYRPDLSIYQEVVKDSFGNTTFYSPFQNSRYQEGRRGESGTLSFSLANTFEMKKNDLKDTINETIIHTKLIDRLNISGNYDFLKDSLELSDISLNLQTAKFLKLFNFTSGATLSPYGHVESSGERITEYAWNNKQGIGRITAANAAITANFTSKSGRKKQKELDKETENNIEMNQLITSNNFTNWDVPWKLNLSYNINYKQSTSAFTSLDTFSLVQTIRTDGDFSIGEKWKVVYLFNFDLQAEASNEFLTNYNISIWRDLHCWEALLSFGQLGPWISGAGIAGQQLTFLFRVNVKADMFKDVLKINLTDPTMFF